MFKLTSLNLNGIRSATRKGLEAWVAAHAPDCMCVQELKAQATDVEGEFDDEGRYVELRFDTPSQKRSILSVYFPSGSSGEHRQQAKYRFLQVMWEHLQALRQERSFVLCGDVNIAHQEMDLKNWKGILKNSGFLPEERAWMTRLLQEGGMVDVFRTLHPEATDTAYTWWSNRGQAYAKNVGWRID